MNRAQFTNWLCRSLTSSCKGKPPKLPADRKPGPPFTVLDEQQAQLQKMMAGMKASSACMHICVAALCTAFVHCLCPLSLSTVSVHCLCPLSLSTVYCLCPLSAVSVHCLCPLSLSPVCVHCLCPLPLSTVCCLCLLSVSTACVVCISGPGKCSKWLRCGYAVVMLALRCGYAVVILWLRCGYAVVMLWSRCSYAVVMRYLRCGYAAQEQGMGGTVYDRDTIMKKYMNGYDGETLTLV